MTDGLKIDARELSTLARDLGMLSGPLVVEAAQKAVEQSAARVKAAWNGRLYREGSARRTAGAITYDVGTAHTFDLWQTDAVPRTGGSEQGTIIAEIGPKRNRGRQAGVIRLLENGSAHNPPHGYGAASLLESEGDFDAALAFAIWAAEREAGL